MFTTRPRVQGYSAHMWCEVFDFMKEEEIQLIVDCLDKGRTLFYYFKGMYAPMLMSYYIGSGKSIRDIRTSRYGRLLSKPIFKKLIRQAGDGILTKELLSNIWEQLPQCYLLTLGKWGRRHRYYDHYQTSRKGTNLVLQLNFSSKHNSRYYKLIRPGERHPFEAFFHPIADEGFHTLAWSRMDIDMDNGEALIEEIQNDWVRTALWKWQVLDAVR